MRILLVVACVVAAGGRVAAQSASSPAPEWAYRIRMVSVPHQPRKGHSDEEALRRQLLEWKSQGVTTIMAHGSFQFLPDLPSGKGQWQDQVNLDLARPFSRAVKDAGLRLFHHTTSTFVPIEAMENPEYREWVSCDIRTGEPSLRTPGTAYGNACFMDMNHPDFQKRIFGRMAAYAAEFGVDGWMTDEVEWLADIYAGGSPGGSRRLYRERFGRDVPTGDFDPARPEWREYITFRYDSGGDFYRRLLAALRQVNPQMQVSGCLAGISKPHRRIWAMGSENWLRGWSLGFFEMEEGFHPRKKAAGYMSTTYWPTYYREMALYNAHGEVNGWPCSYALGYPSTWNVENSEQFYLWAQCLSMGFRFWMRDYQAETRWFAWEAEHEKSLLKPRLIGDIGIFFPEQSRDFAKEPSAPFQNWSGLAEALAWHGIPADQMVRAHFESAAGLERFKLVVMPSNDFVSVAMLATLRQFVAAGGIVLVVGDCATREPFAGGEDAAGEATAGVSAGLWSLLGIAGVDGRRDGPIEFEYRGRRHVYPDGMELVRPLPGAAVLAVAGDGSPAVLENRLGQGRALYFPGQWGLAMFNDPAQRTGAYQQTFQPEQRRLLVELVSDLLRRRRRMEVRQLPAKVMFNAYDTDGDFDGAYVRTLHLLDSYDGYEPGEAFPPVNQPCRFRPFAERNGGRDIEFVLRDLRKIGRVELISPDFPEAKPMTAVYREEEQGFVISVPAREFGRYSVLVVEKE